VALVGLVLTQMVYLVPGRAWALDLERFENEVLRLEERDRAFPPPQEGTVFVGSSTFARWKTLERDFVSFKAVNHGFGGSTIAEVTHYIDRLIVPLHPRTVVFYAGTNDVADGHTAVEVTRDFQTFARQLRERLPHTRLIVLSMNIPPARERYATVYREANQRIGDWVATQPRMRYVDVATAMLDTCGRPQPALYVRDMIHMNRQGYARWILPIKLALQAE
jgi:lysophospholipase L1-like esterase